MALMLLAALLLAAGAPAATPDPRPGPGPGPATGGMGWGMGWGPGWGPGWGQRGADGRFIVMMIPHHEGAIAMAELALVRARHPELRALAARIRSSQSQENARMRRWYREWFGTEVPAWPPGGMGMGMGMGAAGGGGSLAALRAAPDFDQAFLEQMIAHHRMGVHMASHAQGATVHPDLLALEQAMVRVQSEEIAQMERWYQDWFGPPGERRRG